MTDIVLNRASLQPLYSDVAKAAADVEQLLRGLACLDTNLLLRAPAEPWEISLIEGAPGCGTLGDIVDLFYRSTETYDVAAFFGELQRMSPSDTGLGEDVINPMLTCEITAPAPGLEETFPGVTAANFDAIQCALTDAVLASLNRTNIWQFDRMGFSDASLPEALSFDHVATANHGEAVAKRRRATIRRHLTSRNFWERKSDCFPNLRFGVEVKRQIQTFASELLGLAFTRLEKLDEFSRKCGVGAILPSREQKEFYHIKPESDQTMARFGADRRFRGADGRIQTFEEHIWVDRTHRIHLFIHDTEPVVEIGYMGPHLPTVNDPT